MNKKNTIIKIKKIYKFTEIKKIFKSILFYSI